MSLDQLRADLQRKASLRPTHELRNSLEWLQLMVSNISAKLPKCQMAIEVWKAELLAREPGGRPH